MAVIDLKDVEGHRMVDHLLSMTSTEEIESESVEQSTKESMVREQECGGEHVNVVDVSKMNAHHISTIFRMIYVWSLRGMCVCKWVV